MLSFFTGVTPYQSTPYSQGYQTMPSNDLGYHTVTSMTTGITPQSHNLDLYGLQQTQSQDEPPSKPLSPRKQDFTEDYKVQYKHGKDKENEDRKGDNLARMSKGDNLSRQPKENFAAERNYYSGMDMHQHYSNVFYISEVTWIYKNKKTWHIF